MKRKDRGQIKQYRVLTRIKPLCMQIILSQPSYDANSHEHCT
jgi:hypothetical protein